VKYPNKAAKFGCLINLKNKYMGKFEKYKLELLLFTLYGVIAAIILTLC
jgi:hypothetical protein